MNKVSLVLSLIVVLLVGASVNAYTVDDVIIESWAGTGANIALCVVDFWPYNGQSDSFSFGYHFDGSKTGVDMLDALDAADNGFTYGQSGGFVTDMWYVKGDTTYHTTYSWPDAWWSYWVSSDYGESWDFGPTIGERILSNGDCDGWLGKPDDDWDSVPITPVPEPAAIVILGLGGLLLRRRRA